MAFTYDLNTTAATITKDFNGGNGGMAGDIVFTFQVKAATALKKGMVLVLDSGYATCASHVSTSYPIGIALHDADNTDGAAGDLEISVLVRGLVLMNGHVAESGSYDDALVPFTRCGISDDGVNSAGTCVSCGADPTIYIGTMMSTQAIPAVSDSNVLALVYVDLLGPSRAL